MVGSQKRCTQSVCHEWSYNYNTTELLVVIFHSELTTKCICHAEMFNIKAGTLWSPYLTPSSTHKKLLKCDQGNRLQRWEAWGTPFEGGKAIEFCRYQHFQMCITEPIHPLLVSCLEPCFRVSAFPASPWRGEITVRETMTSSPKGPLLQHLPILQNPLNIFRAWNWSWKGRWWYMPVILALEKEAEGPQTGSHPGLHRHVLSLKSGRENEKKIICLRKCKFTLGIPKKNNN